MDAFSETKKLTQTTVFSGDFCSDTPAQSISSDNVNNGQPVHPHTEGGCSNDTIMFQNYMDYSDDIVMNLFTMDQKDRMDVVLMNSPRRTSLFSSPALQDPVEYDTDLAITTVNAPFFGNCEKQFTPSITLRNQGMDTIESFKVRWLLDGVAIDTFSTDDLDVNPSLRPEDIFNVSFDLQDIEPDDAEITFEIFEIDEALDDNLTNNDTIFNIFFPRRQGLPIIENFDSDERSWKAINPIGSDTKWEEVSAQLEVEDDKAIRLNYFGSNEISTQDYLISPMINMLGVASIDISFKYAYSQNPNVFTDGLTLLVSTDCGQTFDPRPLAGFFPLWSSRLNTTIDFESDFSPTGPSEWREVNLTYNQFTGEENVVFALVGNNGGGNHIYLDDISITSDNFLRNELGIAEMTSPPVSCTSSFLAEVTVKNLGIDTISSFRVTATIDNESPVSRTIQNRQLKPGETESVPMALGSQETGVHKITFSLDQVNNSADQNILNNVDSLFYAYEPITEFLPLKVDFTNTFSYSDWTLIRRDQSTDLNIFTFENRFDKALQAPYFTQKTTNRKLVYQPSIRP